MKFTDEQLSRILSAHEGGQLGKGAHYLSFYEPPPGTVAFFTSNNDGKACAVEAAFVGAYVFAHIPIATARHFTGWFDSKYSPSWTSTKLLRELEKRGVV